MAALIGRVLGGPTASFSFDEAAAAWGARALWTYARTRGVVTRKELGWAPKLDDLEANIRWLAAMQV